jgi:putative flippase GtrA
MRLCLAYTLFALFASALNIATQGVICSIYKGPLWLQISIFGGTCTGLIIKYLLDKNYIFKCGREKKQHEFLLYTATGISTTALFWLLEIAFFNLTKSSAMRYAGAAIGLGIGYIVKYQLDKRYVFRPA